MASAFALAGLALLLFTPDAAAQTGTISGVVVDSETGETLIGVNVLVDELGTGAATGLDGDFRIPGVAPGTYTLVFSYIGYQQQRVTGVDVAAGETTDLELALSEQALDLGDGEEVVVEAEVLRDSEVGLLIDRQRAAAVSDAVSAETISRSGAGNAADALQKVPGASVVGGKYLVVRGLSDRYLNTQLNGATLPSADPERNAAPLDLFPSGLLDNIVTSKSFTPDKPGDFTGGSVNISTRTFPEQFSAQVSLSSSLNTQVEPGSDYLLFNGGGLGVTGEPDADLALPAELGNLTRQEIALLPRSERIGLAQAFTPTIAPAEQTAPINTSFSASLGNQSEVAGRPLGYVFGLNWSQSTNGYGDGRIINLDSSNDEVGEESNLVAQLGEEEVLFGGLANLNYRLTDRNEIGLNLIYNKNANSQAVQQVGEFSDATANAGDTFVARSLLHTERTLASGQLRGKHAFGQTNAPRVEWNATYSRTSLDEPDYRVAENEFSVDGTDTTYQVRIAGYEAPRRFFRNLEEDGVNGNLDITLPVGRRYGLPIEIKTGGTVDYRTRAFTERSFTFDGLSTRPLLIDEYGGDFNALFSPASIAENQLALADATAPAANYDGEYVVGAGFAMLDLAIFDKLRFIGGLRGEYTDISVSSPLGPVEGFASGGYDTFTLLGSASAVYAVTEDMNVRAAYGKTLARPTFRELAPRGTFSLRERSTFTGNPNLKQSDIHNVDLRWEWFVRPGEILAVSGFYKRFINPIELGLTVATGDEFRPENRDNADLLGVEIEARRRLDFLPGALGNLQAGGNFTFVEATIGLTETEQMLRGSADDSRPLQGQSPYVINVDLAYADYERGTSVNLFYNVFGRRLYAVSRGGVPDLYEEPRGILDFTASQDLWGGLAVKFSAKNLLDESYRLAYVFENESDIPGDIDPDLVDGDTITRQEYELGRSFSLGITYSF